MFWFRLGLKASGLKALAVENLKVSRAIQFPGVCVCVCVSKCVSKCVCVCVCGWVGVGGWVCFRAFFLGLGVFVGLLNNAAAS